MREEEEEIDDDDEEEEMDKIDKRVIIRVLSNVCCGIHATIGDVVSSMVSARLHHIYVVSSDGHPLSLVTPSDVLRLLSEELIEG